MFILNGGGVVFFPRTEERGVLCTDKPTENYCQTTELLLMSSLLTLCHTFRGEHRLMLALLHEDQIKTSSKFKKKDNSITLQHVNTTVNRQDQKIEPPDEFMLCILRPCS